MNLLEQIRNEIDKCQKITIHEDTGITEMSASEFLFHILDRYQKLSQLFRKDSPDSCYLFEVKEDSSESFYTIGYFSSYRDCIGYHDKYLNEPSSYQAFRIRKIYLSLPAGDNVSAGKSIRASFNSDFSLMDLNCCGFSPGNDAISSDSLVCYLPMPFKKGDILKRKSYSFAKTSIIPDVPYSTPCVFCRGIPSDSGCKQLMDASDIIIYGWYVDRKTGKIKKDHFEHRYDFEYLSGELTSKEKVLYSVSAFLNEETNFNEEEAILTSLYHLTCDKIEEYRKTKDNPLLNYIFLKDNEKSSLRRQYTSVDKLIQSFDQADDSIG